MKEGVKSAAFTENSFTLGNFAAASTSISAYLLSFCPIMVIFPSHSSTSTFGQTQTIYSQKAATSSLLTEGNHKPRPPTSPCRIRCANSGSIAHRSLSSPVMAVSTEANRSRSSSLPGLPDPATPQPGDPRCRRARPGAPTP